MVVAQAAVAVGRDEGASSTSVRRRGAGQAAVAAIIALDQRLCALVQLLPFHAAILEPDFDLSLRQVELAADLPSLLPRYVRIAHELVLKDHRLVASVGLALLSLSGLVWIRTTAICHVCCSVFEPGYRGHGEVRKQASPHAGAGWVRIVHVPIEREISRGQRVQWTKLVELHLLAVWQKV